jgi:iron complex transport system ATP-binding protein
MADIEVKNLIFHYGKRRILDELSFSVGNGRICGLLGPNGSGKTTLLNCINGLRKPTNGEITIAGKPIGKMTNKEMARKISRVPQQTNIVFPFKVIELVVMGRAPYLENWEAPEIEDIENAGRLLQNLGIGSLAERPFNEISGGEKQMVLIARALFQNSEIVLLDEPTAHLDYKNQFIILDLITQVALENNLTVIITLHDPNLAMHCCDEVVMLKKGKILSWGKTSEMFRADLLSQMYDMDINIDCVSNGTQIVIPCHWCAINSAN